MSQIVPAPGPQRTSARFPAGKPREDTERLPFHGAVCRSRLHLGFPVRAARRHRQAHAARSRTCERLRPRGTPRRNEKIPGVLVSPRRSPGRQLVADAALTQRPGARRRRLGRAMVDLLSSARRCPPALPAFRRAPAPLPSIAQKRAQSKCGPGSALRDGAISLCPTISEIG